MTASDVIVAMEVLVEAAGYFIEHGVAAL